MFTGKPLRLSEDTTGFKGGEMTERRLYDETDQVDADDGASKVLLLFS